MRETMEGLVSIVGGTISWLVTTIDAHWALVQYAFAIAAIAALAFLAWTAFRVLRWTTRSVFSTVRNIRWTMRRISHRLQKNRIFRSLKGKFMAKWQIGELGSRIDDAIFDMEMNGRLSNQQGKRLRTKIAKAIGDHQLMPRRFGKMFLRHYFLGSKDPKTGKVTPPVYKSLAGPKKENFHAAGGPPKLHVPPVEDVGNVSSALLNKLRKTA